MSTVGLAAILALCVTLAVPGARAQTPGRVPRVGVLIPQRSTESPALQREPFEKGLRELGWAPGNDLLVEYRYAEGKPEDLGQRAAELVGLKVDVIVARGPQAIRAAQQATTTIPIVMSAGADPVRSGLVTSLARPGGNITGLAIFADDLGGKQLQILKEAIPELRRVGVLVNPVMSMDQDQLFASKITAAAQQSKVQIQVFQVTKAGEIGEAFTAMKRAHVDGLLVRADPNVLEPNLAHVVAQALKHRLPAVYPWRFYVEAGGLMSYDTSLPDIHRRAAVYVSRILKGEKPETLPIELPMKYELTVNLKTARSIGLKISPALRQRADQLVE